MSGDPRKDQYYRALLERTVRVLVEALGAGNLEAVLMIGAPARGEATIVDTPDGLYSLSDIDLVCVRSESADAKTMRDRLPARLVDLNEELLECSKGVDVSVWTRAEIASFPPVVATYEMLESPAVLWGDPSVLENIEGPSLEEIPPAEALKLLHNRIVETLLLHADATSPAPDRQALLEVLYGTAKLALDAVTALLYIERNAPPGYGRRVEVFRDTVLAGNAPLRARLIEFVDDLPAWARFKTEGDLDALVLHLGGADPDRDIAEVTGGVWRRYARYAEVFWREILGRLTATDVGDAGLTEVVSLYAGLESVPRSVARTWNLMRPGAAPDGLFSAGRLARGALFASPRQRAYLTAVVTYLGLAGAADRSTVDHLVQRHSPFRVPARHGSIATEEGRDPTLGSLAVFHRALLLGRAPRRQ